MRNHRQHLKNIITGLKTVGYDLSFDDEDLYSLFWTYEDIAQKYKKISPLYFEKWNANKDENYSPDKFFTLIKFAKNKKIGMEAISIKDETTIKKKQTNS